MSSLSAAVPPGSPPPSGSSSLPPKPGREIAVTLVEKSAEIGGHIISGAVMDTSGLDALIPDWRERGAPVGPKVDTGTPALS